MAAKKSADLSDLVKTKSKAMPIANVSPQGASPTDDMETNNVPLNFRVSANFRRRFRVFAANQDLRLNELLRLAFDEYEERHKLHGH